MVGASTAAVAAVAALRRSRSGLCRMRERLQLLVQMRVLLRHLRRLVLRQGGRGRQLGALRLPRHLRRRQSGQRIRRARLRVAHQRRRRRRLVLQPLREFQQGEEM